MPVNYSSALKDTRLNAVVAAMGGAAVLEIGTAGMASVLASFTLNATPGTVSGGVLTISGLPKTVAAAGTGTAAAARIRTATGGTDVVTGLTVGTSGTDIVINNTSIAAGQQVTLTAGTITHS